MSNSSLYSDFGRSRYVLRDGAWVFTSVQQQPPFVIEEEEAVVTFTCLRSPTSIIRLRNVRVRGPHHAADPVAVDVCSIENEVAVLLQDQRAASQPHRIELALRLLPRGTGLPDHPTGREI